MLSDAANGYYRRNVRMGVPGAGASLGGRLLQRSSLAPNVARYNQLRSINTQAQNPLAMIGMALQRQGMGQFSQQLDPAVQSRMGQPQMPPGPAIDPSIQAAMANFSAMPVAPGMGERPDLYQTPSARLARLIPRRPVPRRTPFVF